MNIFGKHVTDSTRTSCTIRLSIGTFKAIWRSTRAKLYNAEIKTEIGVPPAEDEQAQITRIFDAIDSELSALESKVAEYRLIKQSMIHNLLTGQIHLE